MKLHPFHKFFSIMVAILIVGSQMIHAQAATDLNSVPAQAERLAKLFGSYLSIVAELQGGDQAPLRSKYQALAEDLFTPDAQIEVSSLSRGNQTMDIHRYIYGHFDELVAKHGYTTIALQWKVQDGVVEVGKDLIQCNIEQRFEATGRKNYRDKTHKRVVIQLQMQASPIMDKNFKYQRMLIQSIKVLETKELPPMEKSA